MIVISSSQKRSLGIIFLVLIFGALLGTLLGELLGEVLPAGPVEAFFTQSVDWGFTLEDLNLLIIKVTFGLRLKFSMSSFFGLAAAYYFLRYFR